MLDRIPKPLLFVLMMCAWGGAIILFQLVRFNAFNLDEGAAMALLLNWSVSDQIINPVATYGGPDFRALLFIPLGLYWPGSMVAAKVFTLMFCFAAAIFLYKWSESTDDKETALIATGMFLISPVLIYLSDTISVAPFLLTIFGVGLYLDNKYRASPHTISSLYFVQMLVVAIAITLHPMGLAYPLALAWQWHKNPKSDKQKKQVWTGIGITVVVILAMQTGWIDIGWGSNPLVALHNAIMGYNLREPYLENWIVGAIAIIPLLFLLYKDFKKLTDNLMGSMLILSTAIGLTAADQNWALIAIAVLLYRGTPALIAINKSVKAMNFLGQRGIVFILIMVTSLLFMQANKSYAFQISNEILTPRDQLIQRLAEEARDPDKPFLAASQWPARTMIICRRDVLRLPPARDNGPELLKIIKGITHIIFDHRDIKNNVLARNIAELSGHTETIDIQPSGVIVKIRKTADELAKHPETESKSSEKNNSEAKEKTDPEK